MDVLITYSTGDDVKVVIGFSIVFCDGGYKTTVTRGPPLGGRGLWKHTTVGRSARGRNGTVT